MNGSRILRAAALAAGAACGAATGGDAPVVVAAPAPAAPANGDQVVILSEPVATPAAAETPNPYAGDLLTRQRLTGDWGGARSALAAKGMSLELYSTQFFQGVARGGREREWEYGGRNDYLFSVDGEKAGLPKGLFITLHGETRFGSDVNDHDGLLLPSNLVMGFPAPAGTVSSITELKFTQFLSESFAVYFGKINTLDAYPLRYSTELVGLPGRGGFQNSSLVFNPIAGRTVPYSTAGVGFVTLKDLKPVFSFTVFDPTERANAAMDDLYGKGAVLVPDLVLRTKFRDLPGIYNFGGTYSTARYRSFDPSAYFNVPFLRSLLAGSPVTPLEKGSWSAYANGYQALWVDRCEEKRNWGVFGEFGISDGNPNPVRFVSNAGVGGRGVIRSRPIDTFGAGFFYVGLSDNFKALAKPIRPQQDEYGVELFYNYAVTPWCRVTGDLQFARPSTIGTPTAIIPGVRVQLQF